MSKETAEPIKKYYIAYFDLLGYKNFFRNNPDKVELFLENIHDAIQDTQSYMQEVSSSPIAGGLGQLSIRVKIFSDNILLCLEVGTSTLESMRLLTYMAIVADIQRHFVLQYGLFLRGGITIGTLSFNDDFIFGQGLIDAVALEELAKYPRIIIGQTILDYMLQPHFIKWEDLERACEIERCAHAGMKISDEDLAFCNSIYPAAEAEAFYIKWRDQFILKSADGVVVLNYLYYFDMNAAIDKATMTQLLQFVRTFSPSDYQRLANLTPSQQQRLERHRDQTIQKIKEFGQYADLDITAVEEAKIREHILKKYLWVLSFHNYMCNMYHFPECMIRFGSTCDIRFMRITVEIFDHNPALKDD